MNGRIAIAIEKVFNDQMIVFNEVSNSSLLAYTVHNYHNHTYV